MYRSDDLAGAAQEWASTCKFGHSGVSGENVAAGTSDFTETKAVSAWMAEQSKYTLLLTKLITNMLLSGSGV